MADSVDEIIDSVIRREGGYVDNPLDRGGPTKFGITQRTLSAWRRNLVTADDVQALTETEAREILRVEYIEKPGFSHIDNVPLKELLVDCAVAHGQDRSVRWLQRAVGARADGDLGPRTLEAVRLAYPWAVYYNVLARRIRFYGRIISRDHSQAAFAADWMERAAEFVERTEA